MTLIKSISGIRGTIGGSVGDSLTPIDVVKFMAAFGSWIKQRAQKEYVKIVIGRDARILAICFDSLLSELYKDWELMLDLGLSTTPTVEMAVALENADGGIILTASHNPK